MSAKLSDSLDNQVINEQGIHVIAVRKNRNLMRNDLTLLPWHNEQYIQVNNYAEAVGVMNALKAGVTLESVRRPISGTKVRTVVQNLDKLESKKAIAH